MNKKIMIVDDDREILTLLTFILSRRGYLVETARNGTLALEMLDTSTPDLFIIDIMMPGMNGFELCRKVRARPETMQTPIIIFSADPSPQNKEKGIAVGATDFMRKPIKNADLLVKIASALEFKDSVSNPESGQAGHY